MDTAAFLSYLTAQLTYSGQIVHIEQIPSREVTYAELDKPLEAALEKCLNERSLLPLYNHQVKAVNDVRNGKNFNGVYVEC
jgi:DEAD/DEAH box helicase domain-containing protein